jgi:hypothetical protein
MKSGQLEALKFTVYKALTASLEVLTILVMKLLVLAITDGVPPEGSPRERRATQVRFSLTYFQLTAFLSTIASPNSSIRQKFISKFARAPDNAEMELLEYPSKF